MTGLATGRFVFIRIQIVNTSLTILKVTATGLQGEPDWAGQYSPSLEVTNHVDTVLTSVVATGKGFLIIISFPYNEEFRVACVALYGKVIYLDY